MRFSIARMIGAMTVLMLLVALVQGILSAFYFSQVVEGLHVVAKNRVPAFITIGQLNADLGDVRVAQDGVINAPVSERPNFEATLKEATASLEEGMKRYEALLVDPADKQFFGKFTSQWQEAAKAWDEVKALFAQGKKAEAEELFFGKALDSYNAAGKTLQEAVDDMADDTTGEGDAALASANFGSTVAYAALGLAVLFGLACAVFGSRKISRPLVRITDSMRQLSDGQLDVDIPGTGRNDEIGDMAEALEVFREAAVANRRLEAEAEENRQKAEAERIAAQAKAEADAAERLRIATSGLASGLKRLADGDLSFQLTEAFAPDFEALRHDFNQSVTKLGATMGAVMKSVAMMETGAREIAQGVNDLSRRTEQQAASLEETAAAVEEITSNVQNSSQRTQEAQQVTTQANSSADRSSSVVAQAEEAMRRIEEASQQISNIIGVIDEIAFQTNLLALNAGVEAARAGEAGKGFAVVAQEVRELAQRSAKAAKEIKELIQNSSTQVEGGVTLVRSAGDALKIISGFIQEINQHMASIATSAKEQSTGLSEVNQAVNSMDQVTQQNAAMVEQSNAAANALAQEAERLRDLVGQFKLDIMASQQAAVLTKTARQLAEAEIRQNALNKAVRNQPAPRQSASSQSAPRQAAPRMAANGGASTDWSEF